MSKMYPPHHRTLDADIPELKPFLKSGMKVLDVGCGFGTITVGVAEIVKQGEVVGIDPGKEFVDAARAWAAQVVHQGNITFHVGDSHRLKFLDNSFDVIYSHTVLHFFLDPVRGLREQRRVAKKGGWVIASGVRDIGVRHHHCPHWDQVYDAYRRYYLARLEEYRASGQDPVTFFEEQYQRNPSLLFYYDMHAGRKCAEWFHQAGLVDVRLEIQPRRVRYQGREGLKPYVTDCLILEEPSTETQRPIYKQFMADQQRMIAMGLLDEETLERATEEARAWYKDPGAFEFFLEVFAAGRVP